MLYSLCDQLGPVRRIRHPHRRAEMNQLPGRKLACIPNLEMEGELSKETSNE